MKVNLFAFSWRVFHICMMMTSFKHLIRSCQVLMIVASFQDHTDVRMCTHTREKNLLSHSFASFAVRLVALEVLGYRDD